MIRSICSLFIAVIACAQTPLDQAARTLLESKCLVCHGENKMSGLDMRDAAGLAKGGKRGPAVVPGNAEASLLNPHADIRFNYSANLFSLTP